MLSLHQLRCFLATYEHGSLTAAAEELGYAQPSVSEQVRALEKTLGVPLFRRAAPNIPNRIVPLSSDTALCTARRASSDAAIACSAYGRRVSASVVGTTPRPTRRKSGTPRVFSSARTCSETDGWA